jgi:pentafunctional AROM polypeptide
MAAVAIGMVVEAEVARALGHLPAAAVARLVACLSSLGLPTTLPEGLAVSDLLARMAIDKKNRGGNKAVVLLSALGAVYQRRAVPVADAVLALVRPIALRPKLTHPHRLTHTHTHTRIYPPTGALAGRDSGSRSAAAGGACACAWV